MMKSKRIKWLDLAKGLLIFVVLIYHSVLTSGKILTTQGNVNILNNNTNIITIIFGLFMMQGFFAISGYLYKPTKNFHEYMVLIYKKFISIMLPGIIFTLLGIAAENHHLLGQVFKRWYELFICQYGDTWFLTTLFFVFLIVGLMNLLRFPLYLQLFISIIYFLAQKHFSAVLPNPYIINHVIGGTPIKNVGIYLLFFYLGYIFKRFNVAKYLHNVFSILLICVLAILIAGIDLRFIHLEMIIAFLSVIIIFAICINFNQNNYLFRFLTKYGKFTLIIYLVHWPIVYFLIPKTLLYFHLVNSFTNNAWFLVPCKIVIAWIISLMICYLAQKSNIINFIFYPRKYISNLILKTHLGKQFLTK